MDAYDCISTKLDVRDFSSKTVPADVKIKVLEAGRLTGSGMNNQHWRFILVQERDHLQKLADDSTTGGWVAPANFAVIICTDPKYGFHLIDAGRAIQDMQLAAWNFGVVSCVFTGIKQERLREDFNIPKQLSPSIIAGFGYPARRVTGKRKNRQPLTDLVSLERYGESFDSEKLRS